VTRFSDDDLMRMHRDGDADAFDVLFDRYHAAVYGFARAMLNGTRGADDVLQDTFLAVARAADDYTPRSRFRAWLLRIARNNCLNRLRAEHRRREAMESTPLEFVRPEADQPRPPDRMESDEETTRIRRMVGELPERQREAVLLYAFEGMKYREIAEILEVPINTVKTLIHRGRAQLARGLEQQR